MAHSEKFAKEFVSVSVIPSTAIAEMSKDSSDAGYSCPLPARGLEVSILGLP